MGLGLNLAGVTGGQEAEEESKAARTSNNNQPSLARPDMQTGQSRPRGMPVMNLGMISREQPDAQMHEE